MLDDVYIHLGPEATSIYTSSSIHSLRTLYVRIVTFRFDVLGCGGVILSIFARLSIENAVYIFVYITSCAPKCRVLSMNVRFFNFKNGLGPPSVHNCRAEWHHSRYMFFFVKFIMVSDLNLCIIVEYNGTPHYIYTMILVGGFARRKVS